MPVVCSSTSLKKMPSFSAALRPLYGTAERVAAGFGAGAGVTFWVTVGPGVVTVAVTVGASFATGVSVVAQPARANAMIPMPANAFFIGYSPSSVREILFLLWPTLDGGTLDYWVVLLQVALIPPAPTGTFGLRIGSSAGSGRWAVRTRCPTG